MPYMAVNSRGPLGAQSRRSYQVSTERLRGTSVDLTSFVFRHGANVYAFSYEKDGERRHTLIEAGDPRYRQQMVQLLEASDISPAGIERIFITHSHYDHWGLAALLSRGTSAKLAVHANFRNVVEDKDGAESRKWPGNFAPSQLRGCDFEYLSGAAPSQAKRIGGLDFPILARGIKIGDAGTLTILACPEGTPTHSADQIVIMYSSRDEEGPYAHARNGWRPTDDIVFGGDLWLMYAPRFDWSLRNLYRRFRMRLGRVTSIFLGKSAPRRDAREQDAKAKDALKRGFLAVRVKPGHGEEFIGTQLVPNCLLADRDVLAQLGYPMDSDKGMLARSDVAPKVVALREQAYLNFIEEMLRWSDLGYTWSEVSALLVRIYQEQSGGSPVVRKDRQQRRVRLRETLKRIRGDSAQPQELRELAEATLSGLGSVPSD